MLLIQSIIVYTTLLFIMYWGANRANTSSYKQLYNAVPIIAFTLVFGLRYGVGVDYFSYVDIYEYDYVGANRLDIADLRYEPGFNLLSYMCARLGMPTYMYFTCLSFIQIILIYFTFKDEDDILKYIYLTLMLTSVAIVDFTNGIRQEIAFCFFILALKYIVKKQWIKYLLFVLIAISFHKSAIILLPLGFIWYFSKEGLFKHTAIQISIVLLSFIMIFWGHAIFENFFRLAFPIILVLGYDNYIGLADEMTTSSSIGISVILGLIANIVVILNSKKIKKFFDSPLFNALYDMYIIGICCNYIFIGKLVFLRLTQYFISCIFICYAYALAFLLRNRKEVITYRLYAWVLGITLLSNYVGTLYKGAERTSSYVCVFQKDLLYLKDYERDLRELKLNK